MKNPREKQVCGRLKNIPINAGNTRTYKQTRSSTYRPMVAFRWRGTAQEGHLVSIKAIISASNPGNVLDVRVIRLSDNAAVAEQTNLSFSGGPSERIVSLGIQAASIPDTEDIFEVQLRHAGGPGQSRIHEISLEF